ncbi:MAG: hypothetical protein JNM33_07940 [Rubrivivax sp.]|nr:hypothetical protein [Rubrivivax sp.]
MDPSTAAPRKLSAVEVRVLSRLLDHAQTLTPTELEDFVEQLPPAQQPLVPRLRERLAQIAQPRPDLPPPPPKRLEPVKKPPSRQGERVGAYRLLQELGTPGPETLWLAERGEGAAKVTVALMLPADEAAAERQLVSMPEHPNVERLQYAGIDERGRPFRVMRRVEGVPLLQHARRRRLSAAQRVQLLLPVCQAVAHAHTELLAHGDIRPGNLRVDDEGRIVLLDWGQGRLLVPVTALADLRALAHLLEQVLEGSSPGPDLKAILHRALHAPPADRYPNLLAFVEDLQRVLEHRPVPGGHATALHRATLFARRHRLALAGGAVGVLLLATVLSMAVNHFRQSQQQAERSNLARAFVMEALGEAEPVEGAASAATPAVDPALLAPRLQRALEQTRTGFDGRPVLRGQVLTELALRFRDLGQGDTAQAVLREAVDLLQGTARSADPALAMARAQLAWQLVDNRTPGSEAKVLAEQVLAQCGGSACAPARQRAEEALQRLLAPASK